ncbi:GNAT family N-acetyltransferase [Streptomyces sp. NPDC086010]|uniref:GNAT family N-acetyltransferase n=1 Tax=Streptomyces sp. NPDC086010 TaxID=3365745 RepID=UPI0037D537C6
MGRVITRPTPAHGPGVRIRHMTLADCDAVAQIRVRGWRHAYAGLVPQAHLDAMDAARDAERRRAGLLSTGGPVNLVSVAPDATVTGWACHGPCRDGTGRPARAELYALYVDPDRIGTGTGRALLERATARAVADGFREMALWVLKENTRARRFYERAGFRPDGAEEAVETGGALVPEVRYVRALSPAEAG